MIAGRSAEDRFAENKEKKSKDCEIYKLRRTETSPKVKECKDLALCSREEET